MSSYSEYDLERDLRDARRARQRASGGGGGNYRRNAGQSFKSRAGDGVMGFIRSRTTDHWVMFAIGLVVGAILL